LGSTNALTSSTGTILEQTSYDSFGNSSNATFSSRYQFTGREFDNFSGLYFYRARWYDANIGRFVSEDPIGSVGGINFFVYVENNPINFTDHTGLLPELNSELQTAYGLPGGRYDYGCPGSGLGLGGFLDFFSNYFDMRNANTIGADKFFHCMANCQSSRRGSIGNFISNLIGEGRELSDQYIKGDPIEACDADREANRTGRHGGKKCEPCENVCSKFKPRALIYPLPSREPDSGIFGDCGRFGNWRCK
jgi:RHS repeat-associated protein